VLGEQGYYERVDHLFRQGRIVKRNVLSGCLENGIIPDSDYPAFRS